MAGGPVGGSGGAHTAWVLNLLTDLAFNMLIFFVVCASIVEDSKGRPQKLASSQPTDDKKTEKDKEQTIEVLLGRETLTVNGEKVELPALKAKIAALLAGKTDEAARVVEVKSDKDTPYSRWVKAAAQIEEAGGVITIRLDDEKTEIVK